MPSATKAELAARTLRSTAATIFASFMIGGARGVRGAYRNSGVVSKSRACSMMA